MNKPNLAGVLSPGPFGERLYPEQASRAITAAIDCAHEHLKTADLLFEHARFQHCVSSAILAIEEAGKMPLIMDILLFDDERERWREYSSHPAKTRHLNCGVMLQIKVHFPDLPAGFAEAVGERGPLPDILERAKQRALYSDYLTIKGKCHIHDPTQIDWKEAASSVLADARVFVEPLRAKSAAELNIWLSHAKKCQKDGRSFEPELPALEKCLRDSGFIKEGWWKNILAEGG